MPCGRVVGGSVAARPRPSVAVQPLRLPDRFGAAVAIWWLLPASGASLSLRSIVIRRLLRLLASMTLELMLAIERWLALVEAGLRTSAGHAAPRQAHHLLPWAVSAAGVHRRV